LLERAAEAQEPSAALMLAQTYDPAVLGRQDIRNITPDPAQRAIWYSGLPSSARPMHSAPQSIATIIFTSKTSKCDV